MEILPGCNGKPQATFYRGHMVIPTIIPTALPPPTLASKTAVVLPYAVVGVPDMNLMKSSYPGSRRLVFSPTAGACTSRLHLFNNTLHNIW